MLVYGRVSEMVGELRRPGFNAVVFMPEPVYTAFIEYLNPWIIPRILKEPIKGFESEFYAIPSPVRFVASEEKTERRELTLEVGLSKPGVPSYVEIPAPKIGGKIIWEKRIIRIPHPDFVDEAFLREVTDFLIKMAEDKRLYGKPLFLGARLAGQRVLDVLTHIGSDVPMSIFIMLPLSRRNRELIPWLHERGVPTAFLMGIGTEKIKIATKKSYINKQLSTYILESRLHELTGIETSGSNLIAEILDRVYEPATRGYSSWREDAMKYYGINTIYLSGILLSLYENRDKLLGYNYTEVAETILRDAEIEYFRTREDITSALENIPIARPAHRVIILNSDILIEPYSYSAERYEVLAKRREERLYMEQSV